MTALKDALDVRNIATWPVFVVFVAFSVASNWAANPDISVPLWQRAVVPIAASVFAWVPVLLATVLRRHITSTLLQTPLFVVVVVVLGVTRGLLLAWMITGLAWNEGGQPFYRMRAGVIVSVAVLVPLALVVHASRNHAHQMQRLRQLAMQLRQARDQACLSVVESNSEIVEGIRQRILAEVERLEPATPVESLAVLQRTASEIVRPLSHELASQVPRWEPIIDTATDPVRLDLKAIFAGRSHLRPLMPLASGAVLAAMSLNPAITLLSGFARWAVSPVIFLTSFMALWLANEVIARACSPFSRLRPFVAFVALLAVGAITSGVLLVVLPPMSGGLGRSIAISCAFFTPVLGGAAGLLKSVRGEQRAAEVHLTSVTQDLCWQVARVGQVQWCQHRSLSRALHGPVQNAVTSAAIRLDGALRMGDDTSTLVRDIQLDLERVMGLIENTGDDSSGGEGEVLASTLQRVEEVWSQLAQIDIRVGVEASVALRNDPIAEACVAELISELTSNAVRHGNAQRVVISLSCDEKTLSLVIENDGELLQSWGSGLGSRMLEEMTVSRGRSRTLDGLTYVSAVLPIEQSSAAH